MGFDRSNRCEKLQTLFVQGRSEPTMVGHCALTEYSSHPIEFGRWPIPSRLQIDLPQLAPQAGRKRFHNKLMVQHYTLGGKTEDLCKHYPHPRPKNCGLRRIPPRRTGADAEQLCDFQSARKIDPPANFRTNPTN